MIGAKLYSVPDDFNSLKEDLRELNIDSLFLGDDALKSRKLISFLKSIGIKTYIVFQTYYNPDYLDKNPSSYAITENGNIASDEWVKFICPSDPDYHTFLLKKLKTIINEFDPHGISLDFIRQFIFWEKVVDDTSSRLISSCSCKRCKKDKRNREDIITDTVKMLASEARRIKPDIVVDLHAVPWLSSEYRRDGLSLSGQNLKDISKFVDFITPMCYSHMLFKEPEWINQVVKDHFNQTAIPVIPAVQVKECYREEILEKSQLKSIFKEALKEPSSGVIIWSLENILEGDKRDALLGV